MSLNDFLHVLIFGLSFLGLFGLTELLFLLGLKVEITRKIAHFGTGFITLTFPFVIESQFTVLLLAVLFILLLIISSKFNFLHSINGVSRKTICSCLFPIAIYLVFLLCWLKGDYKYYYLPILILAIADPIAALSGKKWPIGKFKVANETKTVLGSLAFFISCLIVIVVFFIVQKEYSNQDIIAYLVIAILVTLTEAVSVKGWDNLFIPLSVILSMFLFF